MILGRNKMALGMYRHESIKWTLIWLFFKIQFRNKDYIKMKVEWFVRGRSLNIKQNKWMNDNFKRFRESGMSKFRTWLINLLIGDSSYTRNRN